MSWYCCHLDRSQVAAGEAQRRKECFSDAFFVARGPRLMALFQRNAAEGGLDLYLTPDCAEFAADLIAAWGASPCPRPEARGLEFLVGHSEITYYLP